jgi:hypothetical protein
MGACKKGSCGVRTAGNNHFCPDHKKETLVTMKSSVKKKKRLSEKEKKQVMDEALEEQRLVKMKKEAKKKSSEKKKEMDDQAEAWEEPRLVEMKKEAKANKKKKGPKNLLRDVIANSMYSFNKRFKETLHLVQEEKRNLESTYAGLQFYESLEDGDEKLFKNYIDHLNVVDSTIDKHFIRY